jgi:hypothetical protein
MSNDSSDELKKRTKELDEKFDQNYREFMSKSKKIAEIPCARPTLLTSKFFNLYYYCNLIVVF